MSRRSPDWSARTGHRRSRRRGKGGQHGASFAGQLVSLCLDEHGGDALANALRTSENRGVAEREEVAISA